MSNVFEIPVKVMGLSRWRSTLTATFWIGGKEISIDMNASPNSHLLYDAFKKESNMTLSLSLEDEDGQENGTTEKELLEKPE